MTKLEKIKEIIREYQNGSDADISVEDIIEGIDNVLTDDSEKFYNRGRHTNSLPRNNNRNNNPRRTQTHR